MSALPMPGGLPGSSGSTGTTGGNPLSDLGSLFGGSTGAPVGSQSTLSEWVGPYVTDMLGKAKGLTEMPYQVYQGPLTAGPSSLQQQYYQGLGSMGFPGQLGQSFTSSGVASQYMNPFLQNVLQPQLEELRRQAQIQQTENASRMTQAGAFGGGRQAIMDAELQRNLLNRVGQTVGAGYATAYDKAMDQYNKEQGQAMGLAGLLGTAGREQRGIESEGIAADLAEFERQRDYPFKMVQFEQSLLQGLPVQSIATQFQKSDPVSDAITGGGGLMNMYEKWFGPNAQTGK